VYGPRIVDLLRGTPLPAPAVAAARESVAAALGVAAQAPAAAQHAIIGAAQSAFLDGMHAGSWVAAGAALVGAVVAIACLPARAASKDVGEEIGEDIGEGEDVAVADADAIPPPSTALA
jgi:hypothetical protein